MSPPVVCGGGYPRAPVTIAMLLPGVRRPRRPGDRALVRPLTRVQGVHRLGPVRGARHPVLSEVIKDVLRSVMLTLAILAILRAV